jgi:hypothetical protein
MSLLTSQLAVVRFACPLKLWPFTRVDANRKFSMTSPESKKANRTKQRGQIGPDTQLNKNLRAYENAARTTTISKDLLTTAAAIATVGLGTFALPQLGMAEVVFTPVNQSVQGPRGQLAFDLNNDGIPDASVSVYSTFILGSGGNFLRVNDLGAHGLQTGNAIAANKQRYAYAGQGGQRLGSSAHFSNNAIMADHEADMNGSTNRGLWQNITSRRFLGVKFLISGQTHFGWIRFSSANDAHAMVTGYAYETIPNKPIIAGLGNDGQPAPESLSDVDPGSLGRLAAGAALSSSVK